VIGVVDVDVVDVDVVVVVIHVRGGADSNGSCSWVVVVGRGSWVVVMGHDADVRPLLSQHNPIPIPNMTMTDGTERGRQDRRRVAACVGSVIIGHDADPRTRPDHCRDPQPNPRPRSCSTT
jgi:hypothetical protein